MTQSHLGPTIELYVCRFAQFSFLGSALPVFFFITAEGWASCGHHNTGEEQRLVSSAFASGKLTILFHSLSALKLTLM